MGSGARGPGRLARKSLRLVAQGRRDAEIASALTLSVSTVRTHLHNVHAKLKVASRAQAVIRASEMAWI